MSFPMGFRLGSSNKSRHHPLAANASVLWPLGSQAALPPLLLLPRVLLPLLSISRASLNPIKPLQQNLTTLLNTNETFLKSVPLFYIQI